MVPYRAVARAESGGRRTLNRRTELSSWKEIANRLDVSVRAAQLWEKERGLPVRRLPGRRGRVFVRVDELEAWLLTENASFPPQPASRATGARSLIAVGAIGIVVVAIVAAVAMLAGEHPQPADTRVTAGALIVLDAVGDELWRAEFPDALLAASYSAEMFAPRLVDLDGDDSLEVVFTHFPDALEASDQLICYSATGEELWRFDSTAPLATATEDFYPTYRISNVTVADLGDGQQSIVFTVHHYLQYPTRTVVMSADGVVRGDYWHAGHVGVGRDQLQLGDLNQDGRLEIYVSGVNNARDQATLVVLDPFAMSGAGVEADPEYQFVGKSPGRELARVFFPRSSVSEHGYRYNVARFVMVRSDSLLIEVLEVVSESGPPTVIYELDRSLGVRKVIPSDTYIATHRRLYLDGKLPRSLEEEAQYLLEEFQALRRRAGTGRP